jgi:hypothetical protein
LYFNRWKSLVTHISLTYLPLSTRTMPHESVHRPIAEVISRIQSILVNVLPGAPPGENGSGLGAGLLPAMHAETTNHSLSHALALTPSTPMQCGLLEMRTRKHCINSRRLVRCKKALLDRATSCETEVLWCRTVVGASACTFTV